MKEVVIDYTITTDATKIDYDNFYEYLYACTDSYFRFNTDAMMMTTVLAAGKVQEKPKKPVKKATRKPTAKRKAVPKQGSKQCTKKH